MTWFKSPDQIGGWKTDKRNQSDNYLELLDRTGGAFNEDFNDDFDTAGNQIYFFIDPVMYQINDMHQQFYGVGLMPVAGDVTNRAIIGVKPYG